MIDAKERTLNASDRCDYCSAAAKVVATFTKGELLFCGHHARDFKLGLDTKAVSVYDPDNELQTV